MELNKREKLIQMIDENNQKMLKLAVEQKKERELLHSKITEFNVKLYQKQTLELGIQLTGGAAGFTKHTPDGEEEVAMELMKRLESLEEELKGTEEEIAGLEYFNQNLFVLERMTNDEIHDARKELIKVFDNSHANICVKRIGELDIKPFIKAASIKYAVEDAEMKAKELFSLWVDYLRDPNWYPYKIVMVGGTHEEVLDENDSKLKELKTDLGDEVYGAVTTSLNELNEYNPSARYPVQELWNLSSNRKASLEEAVESLLNYWKTLKGN